MSPAEAARPATCKLRILVLDDEPVILIDLRFALSDAGHDPVTVGNVDAALAAVEAGGIDAAVLDVNLGRGATCAPVAERLSALGIPYVLYTGDLDRQGELVRTLGGPVVPKPTPGRVIVERVTALTQDA